MSKLLVGMLVLGGMFGQAWGDESMFWFTEDRAVQSDLVKVFSACQGAAEQIKCSLAPKSNWVPKPFDLLCTSTTSSECRTILARYLPHVAELLNREWAKNGNVDHFKVAIMPSQTCLIWYIPRLGQPIQTVEHMPDRR